MVEKSKLRLKFSRRNRNTKEKDYSIEVPAKTTIDNLKNSKEEVLMREELKRFYSPLNKIMGLAD